MAILNYHPSIKFIGFTIVAFVFLTATFKLKLITSSMASLSGLAASNEATAASHLVFELAQTTHSPPAISVKVRNTHKTKTFTFLIWDTPLDPQALALGVFHVVDSATGKPKAFSCILQSWLVFTQVGIHGILWKSALLLSIMRLSRALSSKKPDWSSKR